MGRKKAQDTANKEGVLYVVVTPCGYHAETFGLRARFSDTLAGAEFFDTAEKARGVALEEDGDRVWSVKVALLGPVKEA